MNTVLLTRITDVLRLINGRMQRKNDGPTCMDMSERVGHPLRKLGIPFWQAMKGEIKCVFVALRAHFESLVGSAF
jgi:hypothetical protein